VGERFCCNWVVDDGYGDGHASILADR
jgi:hypothetical protein